jgi:hypothetical protein
MKSEDDAQGAIALILWIQKTHIGFVLYIRDHFFRYNGENETIIEQLPIISSFG